jgi:glycosyltransferase involved in cell wall biosynthesis
LWSIMPIVMRFLFLEPFYGGSHQDFADGWVAHSRHQIDLVTLPARFWKWRMRGAALHFTGKVKDPSAYHGLIASNLMSLSDLKALWGVACPKALVYFHENQLSYPLPLGETMDYQFGFTDITTGLAADRLLFNSRTHLDAFFAALPGFIAMMPEYRPNWVIERIRAKAAVQYPGCNYPSGPAELKPWELSQGPLIIWNHRWEFDKAPGTFFTALDRILSLGLEFRLALLGENFQVVPKPFLTARERYGARVVQYGYEPSKEKYLAWLREGVVVVSTALQENFGISVVEAIRHGCFPLLPNNLSYPELIPEEYHRDCLYSGGEDLVAKLRLLLQEPEKYGDKREDLASQMGRYAWEQVIADYDRELEQLAALTNGY